jgi:hypothetical protein
MGANVRSAPWREHLAKPTLGSVARRILAALVVIGAVLALTPDRLSGEPTTTGRAATATPTTTPPNPHGVYPRRPGAKYDDIEAPPHGSVTLVSKLTIASARIEARRALPHEWKPADPKLDTSRGLVDGYTPVATDTPGGVLHVVVHENYVFELLSAPLVCIATVVSGGTVLIPYERHPQTATSGTRPKFQERDIDLYFPLGASRGRVYLTCQQLFLETLGADNPEHAVWAIDV